MPVLSNVVLDGHLQSPKPADTPLKESLLPAGQAQEVKTPPLITAVNPVLQTHCFVEEFQVEYLGQATHSLPLYIGLSAVQQPCTSPAN